jgi:hypothetical protein
MRRTMRAEALLSLFTSADHAAAIAGDLTEMHEGDPALFWLDVLRVLPALWRRAVMKAPLRVLRLVALGAALLIGPAVAGIAAVALFPASIHTPATWIAMSAIWSVGAWRTGASLVHMAPQRGMPACATLAVVLETALIALAVRNPHPDLGNAQFALSYTTGLLAPGLLLFGAAIARRRNAAQVSRDAEPQL